MGSIPSRTPTPIHPAGEVTLATIWVWLFVLQTVTWIVQENFEAVAAGQRAPLFGVIGGAHWLAPVIEAEVALILAAIYVLVHRRFADRQVRIIDLERLAARRWNRHRPAAITGRVAYAVPSTPLERWGRQRWQRPPPIRILSTRLS